MGVKVKTDSKGRKGSEQKSSHRSNRRPTAPTIPASKRTRARRFSAVDQTLIDQYRDDIRQAFATFGGAFDIDLIETLVFSIVTSVNQSWIDSLVSGKFSQGKQLEESPLLQQTDLSVVEVHELVKWAESMMYTPGLVHGQRRKAAGIDLIRKGISVLKGQVPVPTESNKATSIKVE